MQQRGYLDRPNKAYAALEKVWDRTEEHEEALASLILASERLWPTLAKGDDDDR